MIRAQLTASPVPGFEVWGVLNVATAYISRGSRARGAGCQATRPAIVSRSWAEILVCIDTIFLA